MAFALLRTHIIPKAMAVAASATPKMIVTIRPEVVSSSSLFMQTSAPAVAEKHIIPGAQEAISVVVATQVEVPDVVWQLEVDFVDVTEQVPGYWLVRILVICKLKHTSCSRTRSRRSSACRRSAGRS